MTAESMTATEATTATYTVTIDQGNTGQISSITPSPASLNYSVLVEGTTYGPCNTAIPSGGIAVANKDTIVVTILSGACGSAPSQVSAGTPTETSSRTWKAVTTSGSDNSNSITIVVVADILTPIHPGDQ